MSDFEDPTIRPIPEMNRAAFVGLASTAIAAASIARALAEDSRLGAPHPPMVSEDDPAITHERPSLARPDGDIEAYVAMPVARVATTPGVVVVQHVWGVDAQMRGVVRRFAKSGFVAIAQICTPVSTRQAATAQRTSRRSVRFRRRSWTSKSTGTLPQRLPGYGRLQAAALRRTR